MRILHYRNSFSNLSETFIYDQVTELEKLGIDNFIITNNHCNQVERPFKKVIELGGVGKFETKRLFERIKNLVLNKPPESSYWYQIRNQLKHQIKQIKPDLIHAHFGPEGVQIALIAKALDIPLVVSFYGHDISRLIQLKFWKNEYKDLFQKADSLVGISTHICTKLVELGAKEHKVRLNHLGIRLEDFPYHKSKIQNGKKVIHCLHVGRLVEKKSPLDLVRAFKIASKELDNIELHLRIAGDGILMHDLLTEIDDLNLGNKVEVLGSVSHKEVPLLMKQADIYTQHCKTASNGDQEGQGVTFVEASAIGLPIVSTLHNGLPDVIKNNESGYLVREGDYKSMGIKIANLAKDPEKRFEFGKSGRIHIENNFNLSIQTKRLIKIYKEVLTI